MSTNSYTEYFDNYYSSIYSLNFLNSYFNFLKANSLKCYSLDQNELNSFLYNDSETKRSEKVNDLLHECNSFNWYRSLRFSNESGKRLIISIAALLISYSKDNIVNNSSGTPTVLINKSIFNSFLNSFPIFEHRDNKCFLGSIEFKNDEEAFNFLRNKLLHGEYIINNGDIIINNGSGFVNIEYFMIFNYALSFSNLIKSGDKFYSSDEYLITFNKNIELKDLMGNINKFDVLRSFISKYKFKFTMKGSRLHNLNTVNLCNNFIKDFKFFNSEYGNQFDIDTIYNFTLDKYNNVFRKYNIVPELNKTELDLSNEDLCTIFNAEVSNFALPINGQHNPFTLQHLLDEFNYNSDGSPIYCLISLLYLIDGVSLHIGKDINNNINYFYPPNVGVSLLNFYISVIYPSENILFNGDGTELTDILNGKLLDFSKLDLSFLDSDGNGVDDTTWYSFYAKEKQLNDNCKHKKEIYDNYLLNYNNASQKDNISSETLKKLQILVENAKHEYDTQLELCHKLENFDINKYLLNLNTIFHIRNIIAHGNYRIISVPVGEKLAYFIEGNDIYNGVSTFSFKISLEQLNDLSDTIKTSMNAYLRDGSSDKEFYFHTLKRDLLNVKFVDKDMINDWKVIVDSAFDPEDDNKIRVLKLTMDICNELTLPFFSYGCDYESFYKYIQIGVSKLVAAGSINYDEDKFFNIGNIYIANSDFKQIIRLIYKFLDKDIAFYDFIFDYAISKANDGSILKEIYDESHRGG